MYEIDRGLKEKFTGEEICININCIKCARFISWHITINYYNGGIYECKFETDIGFMQLRDIRDKIDGEFRGYISDTGIMRIQMSVDESPYIENIMDWLQSITVMNELKNTQ